MTKKVLESYKTKLNTIIINQLEKANSEQWEKPFITLGGGVAISNASGKQYNGINQFLLPLYACANGYKSNQWGTFNHWLITKGGGKREGRKIVDCKYSLKGQKSVPVMFFKRTGLIDKNDNAVLDKNGKQVFICNYKQYSVFNADQVEGLELKEDKQEDIKKPLPAVLNDVDTFVRNTMATIRTDKQGAFYSNNDDYINIPKDDLFIPTKTSTQTEAKYSTLLHELAHWTGHKSRLDRLKGSRFGSTEYAYEELIAESASAFLCNQLGISNAPREDHAHYLKGWLKQARKDKNLIYEAFNQAWQSVEYLNNLQTNDIKQVA